MKNNKLLVALFTATLFLNPLSAEIITISQAYDLALGNSNLMKSSQYQFEANKQSVDQVKAEYYPQINGSISHSKTDYEINKLQPTLNRDITETTTDYMVSLSQNIYNPQTNARLDIEKTRVKLYELDLQKQKQELAKTVLKAYLDILKSQNRVTLLDSYTKYNKFNLDSIRKKFDMNLSNKMDLLQAQVEYNTSNLELEKEKSLLNVYKLRLTNMIGRSDVEFLKLDASKLNSQVIQNIYSKVKDKSDFISNLEIQQALFGIEISKNDVANSYSQHLPKVNFDAVYTKYDSDDYTTDYENSRKLMVSLKLPIYQGGYVDSKVTASKLKLKAANADLLDMQDEIKARYDELIAILRTNVNSVTLYKETLESTKLYLDSVTLGYQNGLKSIIDLYDAKNKVYEVEYKYVENIYGMMDSYIGLLIVTNNFDELKLLDQILN